MSSQSETTMNHFSHPHPLHLSNHQTIATCSGCKSQATGMIYSCKTCNYFFHPNCAKMPQKITHPFDTKGHVLILRPKENLYNYCDACGKSAHGFCYHCKICQIDLHILCASTPLTFTHQNHPHPLKLLFSPSCPEKGYTCDVCYTQGSNNWQYRCDVCDFDVHLHCKDVPVHPVKQPHYQPNFQAFPNQTPVPPAQNVQQQPGFAYSRAPPQVPPPQGPYFQPFIPPPYPAAGVPVNQGMDPNVVAFIQRLQAIINAQNRMNHHQLQALLAGGGVGGGVGGFGVGGGVGGFGGGGVGGFGGGGVGGYGGGGVGGYGGGGVGGYGGGGVGGFGGGRAGDGLEGIQNLIQAFTGGGNIPGLDQLLGNGGGGLDILQGLLSGGINGLDLG